MKTKKIKIKPRHEFESELLQAAKKLDQGEKIKPLKREFFESLEAVRNLLTEKRLDLWRIIRDKSPNSISELAEITLRDFKSIHTDMNILVEAGLVELKKPKGSKTRARKPVSIVDQLQLEVI